MHTTNLKQDFTKPDTASDSLLALFHQQQLAFQGNSHSTLSQRKEQLIKLKRALISSKDDLCQALSHDFGHRAQMDILLGDIVPVVNMIGYTLKHLKRWMQPESRSPGLLFTPCKVRIHYQPIGVVGIIVPWNFPIMLSMGPLINAVAAGNHCMLKLSEYTPSTNAVLCKMLEETFPKNYICTIEGGPEVAAQFSQVAFDHLIFTGSTEVGKKVMSACAQNLTPITLELGGKSPAIIDQQITMQDAVKRLIYGKTLNAGQICVSPDYVLAPVERISEFIQAYQEQFQQLYPNFDSNPDYTSIINQNHYRRLQSWIKEAQDQSLQITVATGESIDDLLGNTVLEKSRKMPTVLIEATRFDNQIMQQEIFGPILPVIGYHSIDEAIEFVNHRAHPLACYLFSHDAQLQTKITQEILCGGLGINETVFHAALDDAPFGGVRSSGIGHYHGPEGFKTFSKAKTVLTRGKLSNGHWIHPPYGKKIHQLLIQFFTR